MQKVANFMSSRFDSEDDDAIDFASFFLGYYTTMTIKREGETEKDKKKLAKRLNNKILTQTEIENEKDKERHNIFEIFFMQNNPRYDIIEEMLRIVVKAKKLPIL